MDKITKLKNFGKRLAMLRKERGLTYQQLADKIEVSRRVIAYYEVESDNPPGNIILLQPFQGCAIFLSFASIFLQSKSTGSYGP